VTAPRTSPLNFTLKVAARCNLNCSYCYVFNKGDGTWRDRPAIMPEHIFQATLERIRHHCVCSGQDSVHLTFHGGEPCLVGSDRFSRWCRQATEVLGELVRTEFTIQTNGTLLDEAWAEAFKTHNVNVGISMDGPKDVHDAFRVDHRGRGSYDRVLHGIALLRENDIPVGVLSVISLGADGRQVHEHFRGLGVRWINYLLPQFTHDSIGPIRARYGPRPCADFLLPILEDWWANGSTDPQIGLFWNIAWLILGGETRIDALGNPPLRFVFVEGDGAIEDLDVLRVCREGIAQTGLNVLTHDFADVANLSALHRRAIFDGLPLPTACRACPEALTCSGGYLPHRYSRARAFDNRSVWCADLLAIFARLRELLQVSPQETVLRREILQAMHADRASAPIVSPG
jgi:uncharacterized protein